jgi:serine protease
MMSLMSRSSRSRLRRIVPLAAVAAALAWPLATTSRPVRAQDVAPAAPAVTSRVSPARLAALMDAATRQLDYLPGEVLVRFRDGVAVEGMQRALAGVRSQPALTSLRWSGQVAVLRDTNELDAHVLAGQLRLQPEVLWAQPNYLRRPHRLQPTDPGFASFQWNLRAIDMPRAWDINAGGDANLIVAVLDTGVTSQSTVLPLKTFNGTAIQNINVPVATNPDLATARLVTPVDLVSLDGIVVDFEGHGSHVAGTIAEDANDLAETGIAFNVKVMPVKVCFGFWDLQFALADAGQAVQPPPTAGGCPDDAVAEGIRYAVDNGARVLNLSLGGAGESEALREALLYAIGKGAFVTLSTGNSFESGNPIEFPAAYAQDIDGVISVGAVGPTRARAYYSGTSSGTEIAAPGGDVRQGDFSSSLIWQMSVFEPDFTPGAVLLPRFDRYLDTPNQGTSMAAPHVAGIAALLASQGVTNPAAIEALIKATALDLGAPGRDDEYGFGLIQPRRALRGFGIFGE